MRIQPHFSFNYFISSLIIYAFGVFQIAKAQDNSECFSEHQFFKMQKAPLSEVRVFLNNEGWEFDGTKTSTTSPVTDNYYLNFDIVKWKKSYAESIFLYTKSGKPNLVIYQTNVTCFKKTLAAFSSKSKGNTQVKDNFLITTFAVNGITAEFRENSGGNLDGKYAIRVYDSKITPLESTKSMVAEAKSKEGLEKPIQKQAPVIDNSQVYTFADEMPEYPGGATEMNKFIAKNTNYPQSAIDQEIQGRVYLSFVVRTDGSITDTKVTRGIKGGCDEEAIRLLSTMPKWKPGKVNGRIVPVQMMLPISFALQ